MSERRRDWVTGFDSPTSFLDHVADISKDTVDYDELDKDAIEQALRDAADELAEHHTQATLEEVEA